MIEFVAGMGVSTLVMPSLDVIMSPKLTHIKQATNYLYIRGETLNQQHDLYPPKPGDIFKAIITGYVDPESVKPLLWSNGFYPSTWDSKFFEHTKANVGVKDSVLEFKIEEYKGPQINPTSALDWIVWHEQATPSIDDIHRLYNRGNISSQVANNWMHRLGWRDKSTRDAILSLRNEVPPIADLIRFAVRDVFNPRIVSQFGYANEYPTILDIYAGWHGLGWRPGYDWPAGTDANGNPTPPHKASWGELYWAAHWDLPSPTQGYAMLQRLYTDSRHGPSPYIIDANGKPDDKIATTPQIIDDLLKAADYPDYWRNRLMAISYNVLTLTDIKRMYRAGVLDSVGVYHALRAYGYGDLDAHRLREYIVVAERPQATTQIANGYQTGLIDELQARQLLLGQGKSEEEADRQISIWRLRLADSEAKEMIRLAHRGMIDGILDEAATRASLAQIGLTPASINRYLNRWNAEIMVTKRFPRLNQFMSWTVNGVMNEDELIGRLQKLRYLDSDITRIIKEVRRQRSLQESKAIRAKERESKRVEKEREQKQKRLEQQVRKRSQEIEKQTKERIKEMEKAEKQRQIQLKEVQEHKRKQLIEEQERINAMLDPIRKASTDKNLIAWYKDGLLSIDDVRQRLLIRGFNRDDADRWIISYLSEDENAKGEKT
ncbi:MAG: hypothetical protein QXW38_09555 [Candidatus Nitrosotenuis sp.]